MIKTLSVPKDLREKKPRLPPLTFTRIDSTRASENKVSSSRSRDSLDKARLSHDQFEAMLDKYCGPAS